MLSPRSSPDGTVVYITLYVLVLLLHLFNSTKHQAQLFFFYLCSLGELTFLFSSVPWEGRLITFLVRWWVIQLREMEKTAWSKVVTKEGRLAWEGCVVPNLRCFGLDCLQLCLSLFGCKLFKAGAVCCSVCGRTDPLFFLQYLGTTAIQWFLLSRPITIELLPYKGKKEDIERERGPSAEKVVPDVPCPRHRYWNVCLPPSNAQCCHWATALIHNTSSFSNFH